jgi:hypothetical protein
MPEENLAVERPDQPEQVAIVVEHDRGQVPPSHRRQLDPEGKRPAGVPEGLQQRRVSGGDGGRAEAEHDVVDDRSVSPGGRHRGQRTR